MTPQKPSFLSEGAEQYWDEVVAMVGDVQTLTGVDAVSLAMICDYICLYVDVRDRMNIEGAVITNTHANLQQHPAIGVRNQASDRVLNMLRELGLTPRQRHKVEAVVTAGDEDDARFFEASA